MGRGRNPKLSEDDLLDAIESITSSAYPVADTQEICADVDKEVTARTVRDTLRSYSQDPESTIQGRKPGKQKGWVWWVHSRDD